MKDTDQRDSIQGSAIAKSTIRQRPEGSHRMKNLDTHHCITIKWSPHSVCRVGLEAAVAASGMAACAVLAAAQDGAQAAVCGPWTAGDR
ncbi:hypothetical protein [Kribbella jiaozuonensis]|uniref:Uncharacterized protein n=1 Tax=Kribbella jiaozuonensis TaxID=2575441 RepID=A0A4U3LWF8_9ACTN|nr:hypothetical protein [Kribbella jiaozuonensis]TKK79166.1 hypothetical protein FDA38_12095 [Kribbella jiaozuonensis]TKK83236.1 hypothetical protein FDA38_11050 [Kribbella jiaozuonensis]